jgi:hypothetical protein
LSELKHSIPDFHIEEFDRWVNRLTYEELLNPPLFVDEPPVPKMKDDVVVNGVTLLLPVKETEKELEGKEEVREGVKPRRKKKRGQKKKNILAPPALDKPVQVSEKPAAPNPKPEEPSDGFQVVTHKKTRKGGKQPGKKAKPKPKAKGNNSLNNVRILQPKSRPEGKVWKRVAPKAPVDNSA